MKPGSRVWCSECKAFTEHVYLEHLTGTPGYYLSTVGRGADWWQVRCESCNYTYVGDFQHD